jgi:pimeloyl-ACP methyl ester carboxylesterase
MNATAHQTGRRWLLLHGTPLGPEVWAETAHALGHDAALTPDCRAVPEGDDPQRRLAHDLAARFDGDLDVVGHSFGGQVALEFALAVPERVRSLTILCSRDTPFPAFGAVADAVASGTGVPTVEASLARWFSADELAGDAHIVELARSELRAASLIDWSRALAAIAVYDSSAETPSLRMPVSIVAARHDAVSTPDTMREMAGRIPGAQFSVHDDWFHMSPFVDARALARLLQGGRDRS